MWGTAADSRVAFVEQNSDRDIDMEDVEPEVESTETCHGLLRSDMKDNEPKSVETHEDMVRLCKFCKNALDKQDPEAVIAFQAVGE